jgi:hypothetical protein
MINSTLFPATPQVAQQPLLLQSSNGFILTRTSFFGVVVWLIVDRASILGLASARKNIRTIVQYRLFEFGFAMLALRASVPSS